MAIIWILISIFLLLVEFMTVKIIYIWYSLSALISLIIAFNNRILQSIVDKYKDIPIVLYDGDELKFFFGGLGVH